MTPTMIRTAGSLAMSQTATAPSPRPIRSPTQRATGPVTTSATITSEMSSRIARVRARNTGRSFQIGRPSSMSYTRFMARPKALT